MKRIVWALSLILAIVISGGAGQAAEPLPSWQDGKAKAAIIDFVEQVSQEGGPHHVAPAKRIAVFDNDGTLWSEKPVYFQLLFAIDRIKALAAENPDWKDRQPFKAVLENDMEALAKSGKKGIAELVMASHAGMSTEERNAAQGRFQQWRDLAPERQDQIRERYRQFQEMSPEEQSRVRDNFRRFQRMPIERRQLLRDRFRDLTPEHVTPFYRERAQQVVRWFREGMTGLPCRMHKPEGAFFLWLWLEGLPQGCTALYRRLKQRGVLIVPGRPCFFGLEEDWPHSDECIRVSYVQEEGAVRRGVAIICDEVRRMYDEAG